MHFDMQYYDAQVCHPHAAGSHAAFGVDAPCRRTWIDPSAHAHTAVDTQPRVLPSDVTMGGQMVLAT